MIINFGFIPLIVRFCCRLIHVLFVLLRDFTDKEAEDVEEEKKIEAERLRMMLENNFKDLVRHIR